MKTIYKFLLVIIALLALVLVADLKAQTYVSPISIGTTNVWWSNAVTTVSTAGGAAGVDIQRADNIGMEVRYQNQKADNDNSSVTLRFARSPDGTYWETTNWLAWTFPLGTPGAGYSNMVYTNFPAAAIGAAAKIRLERIEMPAYATITGCVVRVIKKQPR
jgi:hypothetical protein